MYILYIVWQFAILLLCRSIDAHSLQVSLISYAHDVPHMHLRFHKPALPGALARGVLLANQMTDDPQPGQAAIQYTLLRSWETFIFTAQYIHIQGPRSAARGPGTYVRSYVTSELTPRLLYNIYTYRHV